MNMQFHYIQITSENIRHFEKGSHIEFGAKSEKAPRLNF